MILQLCGFYVKGVMMGGGNLVRTIIVRHFKEHAPATYRANLIKIVAERLGSVVQFFHPGILSVSFSLSHTNPVMSPLNNGIDIGTGDQDLNGAAEFSTPGACHGFCKEHVPHGP